jgi:CheY-like chemotaxis protein
MQFGRWLSLRSFLAAILALSVCVGGGCLILAGSAGDAGSGRLLDQELQRTARAVAEKLGDGLAIVERDASLAAEHSIFERGGRAAAVQEFLGRWRSLHPNYADILFADRAGQVLATASGSALGADVSGTTWFARAMTGLVVGDATGRSLAAVPRNVIVGAPVRAQGGAAGVLAIQLAPTWIEDAVAATRRILGGSAQTVLVNVVNAGGLSVFQSGSPAADGDVREANAVVTDEAALGWVVVVKGRPPVEAASALLQGFTLPLVLAAAAFAGCIGWLLGGRLGRSLASIRHAAAEDRVALLPRNASITDIADLADAVERSIGRSTGRERIQRETRAALARSRDRVRAVKLLSGFTCWEIDLRNGQVTWAAGSADMADSTSERADHLDEVLSRIHPEDRRLLRKAMQAACDEPGSIRETAVRTLAEHEEATGRQLQLRMTAVAAGEQPIRLHMLSREIGLVALPAPRGASAGALAQPAAPQTAALGATPDPQPDAIVCGLASEIGEALTSVTRALGALEQPGAGAPDGTVIEAAIRHAARGAALTRKLSSLVNRGAEDTADTATERALAETVQLVASAILPGLVVVEPEAVTLPALACTARELEVMLLNLASDARASLPKGADVTLAIEPNAAAAMDDRVGLRLVLTAPNGFRADRGLAAIENLMAGFDGAVAVENVQDRTVVTLSFPKARPDAASSAEAGNRAATGAILLIEPDAVLRAATAESLTALGYAVTPVADAEAGHDALAAHRDFEAVLCAHTMPAVNGVMLADVVARTHPSVDIVLMAAEAPPARSSVTFRWLQKPFGSPDLAQILRPTAVERRDAA